MKYLIDTCAWIEWLTNAPLSHQFEYYFRDLEKVLVPTLIQFELYRWVEREKSEEMALEIIGLTEQAKVIPLTTRIALHAAELSKDHGLAMADAIIYATARDSEALLVTSDKHFKSLAQVKFFSK